MSHSSHGLGKKGCIVNYVFIKDQNIHIMSQFLMQSKKEGDGDRGKETKTEDYYNLSG